METILLSILLHTVQPSLLLPVDNTVIALKVYPIPAFTQPPVDNLYAWGNCTRYVAGKVSIPNTWGNANTWLAESVAQGYVVGKQPKRGSIAWFEPGWSLGHVAYVEEVYSDNSFRISEMNVLGLNIISSRIITNDSVEFIYGKV